jgi:HSP20 family molecular chaperone IbpA
MFFAAAPSAFQSNLRRPVGPQTGRSTERFLADALFAARQQSAAYTQDDTAFSLTLDMPGIAKDQLNIAIEGAVVRIQSKEGAPRRYRAAYELPQDIDTGLSEAKLENGVLTLKLAKKVPVSNASELTIQ